MPVSTTTSGNDHNFINGAVEPGLDYEYTTHGVVAGQQHADAEAMRQTAIQEALIEEQVAIGRERAELAGKLREFEEAQERFRVEREAFEVAQRIAANKGKKEG